MIHIIIQFCALYYVQDSVTVGFKHAGFTCICNSIFKFLPFSLLSDYLGYICEYVEAVSKETLTLTLPLARALSLPPSHHN